jgi:phosphoribosylaminoimidazole (AIR) synthetase
MGIGYVAVVAPSDTTEVQAVLNEHGHRSWIIGEVLSGPEPGVRFV